MRCPRTQSSRRPSTPLRTYPARRRRSHLYIRRSLKTDQCLIGMRSCIFIVQPPLAASRRHLQADRALKPPANRRIEPVPMGSHLLWDLRQGQSRVYSQPKRAGSCSAGVARAENSPESPCKRGKKEIISTAAASTAPTATFLKASARGAAEGTGGCIYST